MSDKKTDQASLQAERIGVLQRFSEAWGRSDIEQLMALVTDDCIYSASVGPEPGHTYVGREAIRDGFVSMLAFDASGESREGRMFLSDSLAVAEWSYVHSNSGSTREVRGCDIIEFRGAKICKKDAFRKCDP